jgi:cytidyltransferase-like protein
MSKIGLYWGTFDPPTLAHLNVMLTAIEQGDLDRLIVVVNDNSGPKHYHTPGVSRAQMIIKMLLEHANNQTIKKVPIEIMVQNDHFKIDEKLIGKLHPGSTVVPVVGQDSFVSSAKYCSKYHEVIVAPRDHNESELLKKTILEHNLNNIRVLTLDSKYLTMSSTQVRNEINHAHETSKQSSTPIEPRISNMVSQSTSRYIRDHYFFKDGYHAEHHSAAKIIQPHWRKFLASKEESSQTQPPVNQVQDAESLKFN